MRSATRPWASSALARVGSEVARRAQGFGMSLIAYDPFVAPDYARILGVELVPMEKLLSDADFVTIHTPLGRRHPSSDWQPRVGYDEARSAASQRSQRRAY